VTLALPRQAVEKYINLKMEKFVDKNVERQLMFLSTKRDSVFSGVKKTLSQASSQLS
jgi:hypothetical protein